MKEGDVVVGRLVPTDQNAPEAVQPAVSAFHHPAAGFEPSFPFDGLSLFASTPDVGGEAELVQGAAHLSEVVALVQAQTLGMFWSRRRARHRQAVHRSPHQLHIVAVGPVHCQPNRNTLGVGQQTAFDTPIRGVGTGFFPRSRETWSWPHPSSANSSPDPSIRHNAPVPPAVAPGIPQRRPIPESAGGRWSRSKCPLRPRLSTGSRYAARSRCRWRTSGLEPEAGRRPKDGCSLGVDHVSMAGAPSRRCRPETRSAHNRRPRSQTDPETRRPWGG